MVSNIVPVKNQRKAFKMKILHLNTGQEGGAALCVRRINNSLVQQGIDSRILFAEGSGLPNGVEGAIAKKDRIVELYSNELVSRLRHLLMKMPWYLNVEKLQTKMNDANTEHQYLHQPLSYFTNISHHPLVEWADIVHLHWVPDFVDYPSFFREVKKTVVWTLHDMYPAVGVMHFESEYTVRAKTLDEIDTICRKIKKKGLEKANNLHIVAISEIMKEVIQSSELLNGFPVTLIHNGVDTELFRLIDNEQSVVSDFIKSLSKGTKVFLFSSYWIWDKRKGLDRVLDALEKVRGRTSKDIALIAIGSIHENDQQPKASFPVFCTGLIKDQHELAKVYSSADYFINASYEEAFAQTPLEAMACGVPVISTPCSGASDLIRYFNGVICGGYDAEAVAAGIANALMKGYCYLDIRKYIIDNFDYSIIAKKYIRLYEMVTA